ncbi:SDR family oxidoreductase [Bradyrhizobium sp. Leo170]|uniref:SDR family oxidoreductase n=1 Tax=Bradyrhizobium sp. Leo170 TaxID=1571199 RepID=UPI00102E8DD5|nr:SDR family oxidoreductase [Bradyrhizobium sp. Leo170]TAI66488.1 short chain dehydrogenase [Bradyrhizobium sp. Leo170]
MAKWTTADMPSLHGRSVIVTGTGGLGFEDALALACAGAEVIVAGRNPAKGAEALARIREAVPQANAGFEELDLASLASIAAFSERLRGTRASLDVLINNAGVMVPPVRRVTSDGFELQFGTNYLGHFALTAGLMPLLRKGRDPRVVTISSVAARNGKIDFDNLQGERDYKPMAIYSQSKLADLMFALELQRRSDRGRWGVASLAAHPGVSRTDLLPNGAGRSSIVGLTRRLFWFMFQPAAQGALPTLFAATSPDARPGTYYGPDKMNEMRGHPAEAKLPPQAKDAEVAFRLWEVSERLCRVQFG